MSSFQASSTTAQDIQCMSFTHDSSGQAIGHVKINAIYWFTSLAIFSASDTPSSLRATQQIFLNKH